MRKCPVYYKCDNNKNCVQDLVGTKNKDDENCGKKVSPLVIILR